MVVRAIFRFLIMILFSVKVEGAQKLPKEGPVIVCANHISWWDPPLVACILKRPVAFMAKKELFKNPVFGYLLKKVRAFPVDREGADIGAIRRSISVLKDQGMVGIFPEGTRQKTENSLGQAHAGAALLALRTKAAIFPIAIRGKYKFRGRVNVLCGEPFVLEASAEGLSSNLEKGSGIIMEKLRILWEKLTPNQAA